MLLRGGISISILLIEKPCCESLLCNRSSSSLVTQREREILMLMKKLLTCEIGLHNLYLLVLCDGVCLCN